MIESSSNAQVKNVIKLLKNSRERKKQNSYIIEGPKMVLEAVKAGAVNKVYISDTMWSMLNSAQWNYEYSNNRLAHVSAEAAREMIASCNYDIVKHSVFATMSYEVVPQ